MKAVMISVPPKKCEKVVNGDCTILVKKTRPKIDTPFKCYIYCTQDFKFNDFKYSLNFIEVYKRSGKVIGEFVCDRIEDFSVFENGAVQYWNYHDLEKSCLTYDEISNYIGKNKDGYAWHISDLVIYDEPKELSEFKHYCEKQPCQTNCWKCDRYDYMGNACYDTITRPPQSWCYVEEME